MTKKYNFEYWNIAIRKHIDDLSSNDDLFTVIPNKRWYWAADPFIFFHNDKYYIFAELYSQLQARGKIGVIILDKNGNIEKKWKIIMDNKMHLSFPYVFEYNQEIYMLPETNREREISIYKATDFPYKWEKKNIIYKGERLADSIFLNSDLIMTYDNFQTSFRAVFLKRKGNAYVKVFSVDDEKLNLRPAGKVLFDEKESYILPLQNCDGEYGKSVYISKLYVDETNHRLNVDTLYEINNDSIEVLDYKEKIYGIHTYNYHADYEVIDLKTYNFSLVRMLGHANKKFKKLIIDRIFR